MKAKLKEYQHIAEAFAKLLHPFAEVVIHDLATDTIAAIYNPISKREVGDPSFFDGVEFKPEEKFIGPAEKINHDGRKLKSVSIILRNDEKKAIGTICINMDISVFERYRDTLQLFLSNNDGPLPDHRQEFFKDSMDDQISIFIQNYCRENNLSFDALSKNDKQELIFKLKENGAFNAKNATTYIARVLNISRATVYNYLKEGETA
jgi:predicted transcriptional regulator YheO